MSNPPTEEDRADAGLAAEAVPQRLAWEAPTLQRLSLSDTEAAAGIHNDGVEISTS